MSYLRVYDAGFGSFCSVPALLLVRKRSVPLCLLWDFLLVLVVVPSSNGCVTPDEISRTRYWSGSNRSNSLVSIATIRTNISLKG